MHIIKAYILYPREARKFLELMKLDVHTFGRLSDIKVDLDICLISVMILQIIRYTVYGDTS